MKLTINYVCEMKLLMLNCDCYIALLETILLCAKKCSDLFKKCYQENMFANHINSICMYKQDLALNNLQ